MKTVKFVKNVKLDIHTWAAIRTVIQ